MISFTGFNENMITFNAGDGVTVGAPVVVSSDSTVSAGEAGNVFCGIARSVRDGAASVQMSGYMKLGYTGTAPTHGNATLVCDGSGGVKTGAGRTVTVVEVDTVNSTVGFIL